MRLTPLLLAFAVLAAGCSKKQPEVAPTPTTEPQPAAATPAPSTPTQPVADPAACELAINSAVGEIARMVNFDTDKYDVRPEDMAILDAKLAYLQGSPSVRLRLTGHADERYTDEYRGRPRPLPHHRPQVQQLARDDQALHLARALADRADLGVAQVARPGSP